MATSPRTKTVAARQLSTSDDVRSALEAGLATVIDRLDVPDAVVAVVHPDGRSEWRSTPSIDPGVAASLAGSVFDHPANGRSNGRGTTVSVDLAELPAAWLEIGDGTRAVVLVPAAKPSRGAAWKRTFGDVAEPVMLAVARAVLLERDRRRSGELTRLLATAKRVAASLELDTVLSAIVQDAVALIGADSGDMLLWDRDQNTLRVVAVSSFPPEMVGFELTFGEGLTSQAILAQRTLQVDDYRSYEHRVAALDAYDFGSVLCSPLLFRGAAIGAINVHARKPRHPFKPGDADLLQAFAGLAAIAIDHARQYENEVRLGRELSETNRELVRSLSLQQRLTDRVLQGGGPLAVAMELAQVLDRAVVIQDHLWRPIAGAAPDGGDTWRPLVKDRPDPRPGRRHGSSAVETSDVPGGWETVGGRLIVPIRLGSDLVGHLVIAWEATLGAVDRALVHIASTCAALEFAKIRAAIDVEQRVRGDVVMELLQGRFGSEDAISQRAARLGYDLAEPRDLLVIDFPALVDGDSSGAAVASVRQERRILEVVEEHLEREAPRSIVGAVGGSLVVLAADRRRPHLRPVAQLARDLQHLVSESISGNAVSVGIGDRCAKPSDYPGSFRLARESVDVMAKLGRRHVVVGPDELGAYRVLIKAADREELERFARSVLSPLVEHDERTRGGLVDTLRAYLAEGYVQRRTAERLFVHVNTVVYRLHRIEELLGRDLEDPGTVFELSLAIRILDLVDGFGELAGGSSIATVDPPADD